MICMMKRSGFHSGGMDWCGGSTRTKKLILSGFGMERVEVMEKLKVRWCGRRGFSTRTLLQIYGLKVSLVNPTLCLRSEKVPCMVQVKREILQGCKMSKDRYFSMNGPNSS